MRSIETDGDTIDDAITNALRVLQMERDHVEIEILGDAERGLFGFGGRRARVRATVRSPLVSRETETMVDGSPGFDVGCRAREILAGILPHLGVPPSVQMETHSSDDGDSLTVELTGDGAGLAIGGRGQTLDALEYLVNRMVYQDGRSGVRIVIDVENYRQRRQAYLGEVATHLAAKAKDTGRTVIMDPLSPRDRRIVHLALQDHPGVATRSEGDGYYRRVTIIPAGEGRERG